MLSELVSLTYMLQYINIAHFNKSEEIHVHVGLDSKQNIILQHKTYCSTCTWFLEQWD
jgi:hypothetical protein